MPLPLQRGPSLQQVADAAGVHRSTASRALNPATAHLISPEITARIRAASQALGYRRDAMAAGLRTRRSHLVGVLVPDIANPVFGPILSGLESPLKAAGYSLLIVNAGNDATRQAELAEDLIARRVDGIVLATVQRDDPVVTSCLRIGLPIVLVNRAESTARTSSVVSDDVAGMGLSVRHLTALGHCAIGHIAGPPQLSTGLLRRQGFETAMTEAGLDATMISVATGYSREAGLEAAETLLSRHLVTAIAAANDLLALGAYQALARRGLRCPQDVSVVGYNDMPLVDMVQPPLTTIRINPVAMGQDAAALLLGLIDGNTKAMTTRIVNPVFVPRQSTAPPNG
ncbi:MAG TPA: LacI family DNA-binding transcriptional regulator [Stellaceae bacterium]|jgi:LacI family transcriptional regulator|nr:LacI family DNA-binding transcriptional regulator [Stellaceae bacterium]